MVGFWTAMTVLIIIGMLMSVYSFVRDGPFVDIPQCQYGERLLSLAGAVLMIAGMLGHLGCYAL